MKKLLYNMWVMGKVGEKRINDAVEKDYITQAEADEILDTPQRS